MVYSAETVPLSKAAETFVRIPKKLFSVQNKVLSAEYHANLYTTLKMNVFNGYKILPQPQ